MIPPFELWYRHVEQRRERAESALQKLISSSVFQRNEEWQQILRELYDLHLNEVSSQYDELYETQIAIQEALDKYKELYDLAPVGYVTLDDSGVILEANLTAAALLGMERQDLIRRLLYDFLPTREEKDAFYLHCNGALTTGRLGSFDLTMQRTDGSRFIAHLESRMVNTEQRQLYSALSDITARRKIEADLRAAHDALEQRVLERTEALQQANERLEREIIERQQLDAQVVQTQKMQAIGSLAGGVAHEFNNVLAIILGFSQLLENRLQRDAAALRFVQEIRRAGERAKEFVQQILLFSRSDSGVSHPASLSLVINDALGFLRQSLPTTIELRARLEPEVESFSVAHTPLFQVLINLCSNAEYAMRASGGRLSIEAAAQHVDAAFAALHPELRPGPHARIAVRDTGVGIAPEVMSRLFEPFFTTKGVGEGTGMGLAIVHGIVAKQGGVVTVESAPGVGTTFTLYLPPLDAPAPLDATGASPASTSAASGRLLVVDDDVAIVRVLQELLKAYGYEVVTAASGIEALNCFQADPHGFDCVVTDQTMPRMTGIELIQSLRRLRADIPAILCTGFSHAVNEAQMQPLGIDALMMKPVEPERLVAVIQRLLTAR